MRAFWWVFHLNAVRPSMLSERAMKAEESLRHTKPTNFNGGGNLRPSGIAPSLVARYMHLAPWALVRSGAVPASSASWQQLPCLAAASGTKLLA